MSSRRRIGVAVILAAVAVVAAVSIYSLSSQPNASSPAGFFNPDIHLASDPIPQYECNFSALNPQAVEVPGYSGFYNVSQGSQLQVNVTFTSITSVPVTVQIDNLTLTYFTSTVNLNNVESSDKDYSAIQQSAFTYSFSQNQLTLGPSKLNSTLLTIDFAQNAPTGQYTIDMPLGQLKDVNGTSYSMTEELPELIVTAKAA